MGKKFLVSLKSLLWVIIPAATLYIIEFIQTFLMYRREGWSFTGFWGNQLTSLGLIAWGLLFVGIPFFIANVFLLTFLEKKRSKLESSVWASLIYVATFLLIALVFLIGAEGLGAAIILLVAAFGLPIYIVNAFFICRRYR